MMMYEKSVKQQHCSLHSSKLVWLQLLSAFYSTRMSRGEESVLSIKAVQSSLPPSGWHCQTCTRGADANASKHWSSAFGD